MIPVDRKRCQAEKYMPFVMGGSTMQRCSSKAAVVVRERKPGPDGKRGAMALCAACLAVFRKTEQAKDVKVTRLR